MAGSELEIDAIVRQVMAALRDGAGSPATERPTPAANTSSTASRPSSNGRLELSSRVVTLDDFSGRIDGVKEVAVATGAVVTPAARDLLREKNIRLAYRAADGKPAGAHNLVFGQADTDFDAAALVRDLRETGAAVEQLASTGLATVVAEMSQQVARGGLLGLLLTSKPAAAACLANRRAGVRAAAARDAAETSRAITELGANLLTVDPAGKSLFELRRMTRAFLAGGERRCPSHLATELN